MTAILSASHSRGDTKKKLQKTTNKDFNGETDNGNVYSLILDFITRLTEMGGLNDFLTVLRAIVYDKLSDNKSITFITGCWRFLWTH